MIDSTPTAAASVLVIAPYKERYRVLITERAKSMAFAPGHWVFPGGKVDISDRRRALWRQIIVDRRLPSDFHLRVAALRELYEETGVRIPGASYTRRMINMKDMRLEHLKSFSHWVTPKAMPVRFDTQFYIVLAPRILHVKLDGREAVSHHWLEPAEILDMEKNGTKLMLPTRMNLIRLALNPTIGALKEELKRWQPQKTIPIVSHDGKQTKIWMSHEWQSLEQRWRDLAA